MTKEQKFTKVFEKHNRLVRKVVMQRTGDWSLSEEICQKVFLKYFENMETIQNDIICPWLMLCTRNMLYDHFRRQNVRRNVQSLENMDDLPLACRDNAEAVIQRIAGDQLTVSIMSELYENHRSWYNVLELVCVRGLSYEEAARALDIPRETVRARMFRVRKYVRSKYGDEFTQLY